MGHLTIVHILRAPMGGVMRHVRDLARLHAQAGHKTGIICDVPGTDGYNEALLAELDQALPLGVQRVSMQRSVGPGDFLASRKVTALIDALNPDVLHGHGAKGGVYARLCGNGRPARLYSPHGGSLHYDAGKPTGMVYFKVERWLERKTDRMLFVADFERRTYESKIGALTCPWTVCYNGLGEEEFIPLRTAESAVDFLFIGEIRTLKGPDVFVEALKRLHADGIAATARMVGAGPQGDEIQNQIRDAGLSDYVTMSRPAPAREAFAGARTVVIPSRAEAMPYIVIEALAAGKPVITTRVGGIPEIFASHSGALIDPGDPAQLYRKMKLAAEDSAALAHEMPDLAALKDRFSAQTMADTVLDSYLACLAKN